MKVIGLIGGMSWFSSLEYYRLINELVAEKLGGLHSARIVLYSLDFDEIEQTQHQGRWDDATTILSQASTALKQAGADFLVICTNTMHKIADAVRERAGLPFIDIVEVTGNSIVKKGLGKVGLLGSRFVMEEPFYRGRLKKQFDIEVLVPDKEERAMVDRIIFDELCQGKIEESSHCAYINIITELIEQGAEGIILGCTELPLLIRPGDVPVPLFDTMRLHAEAAVNLALAEE
ncbi:L-aspartate/glutamate-specific racemase [subsurface metagenome]